VPFNMIQTNHSAFSRTLERTEIQISLKSSENE
jgi:hypothetical protein